jgi:hypothetical protein
MAHVTIRFPDELFAKAEVRAAQAGHASVAEYVQALVTLDAGGVEAAGVDPLFPVGDADVEAMLLRRMESSERDVEGASQLWKRFADGEQVTGF